MKYNEVSTLILEESNDIIYIADPCTYELIYLNRAATAMFGYTNEEQWKGKKCYKMLQNKDAPCEFCTNSIITDKDFYVWEHYNSKLKKHFTIKDKLVKLNNKYVRLELATDTTEKSDLILKLRQKLETEETLITCFKILNQNDDIKKAINNLLEIVGNYYKADRSYIFEINYEKNIMTNTYEWCKNGVASQIDNLSEVPIEMARRWLEQFKSLGEFYITALDENVDKESEEYKILESQDINSLIAAPLTIDNKVVGFLGVDNPATNWDTMMLIKSVASFIAEDINKREMMEQLTELSYTDSLTGIGNRHSYIRMIDFLKKSCLHHSIGIIYLDINGLKLANDTYGHKYGDFLIKHTAEVLKSIFDNNIYRIGGDEFIILCSDIDKKTFDKKTNILRKISFSDNEFCISIGASWHSDCTDILQHIMHTDELMYIDKQKYYGMRLDGMGDYHASLSHKLIDEIKDGRFIVYLQPKIELKTGRINGAEALIRKIDSNGNLEFPASFISHYEAEGIIRHVDFFVLDKVCQILKQWLEEGRPEIKIAVNISRVTLLENNITEKLLEVCRKYDISPRYINIEVTESIGIMERDELKELMTLIKDAGFTISLDDFGSEYSNLSILTLIDFNEIKLDKSLIDNLENNKKSRIIAEYTIKMCKKLDYSISVAEGIETSEQRDLLETLDCTIGQGYYFDKPMDIKNFETKYMKKDNM